MNDTSYVPSEKLKKAALYLVLFLCVFIPIRSILEMFTTSYVKLIPDILILILLAWYTLSIRFRFRFLPHDWFFLLFLAFAFFGSMFINHSGLMPYIYELRSIGIYYILYFVTRNLAFGRDELDKITKVSQVMAIILTVFAFIEVVSSKTLLFPVSVADDIMYVSNYPRAYSLLLNPNTFALFINFVFFMSFFRRICYGIKTPLSVYCILGIGMILSVSRSGAISLIAGSAVIFFYLRKKYRDKVNFKKLLVSALIVLIVSGSGYGVSRLGAHLYYDAFFDANTHNIGIISESLGIDGLKRFGKAFTKKEFLKSARDGRLFSIKTGLEIIQEAPVFGTGVGTYGSAASMVYRPANTDRHDLPYPFYADNEYIKDMVETGIVGLALFMLYLFSILRYYRKDWCKIALCIMMGWFGMFYNIFEVQAGSMFFWVLLGFSPFPTTLYLPEETKE